MAEAQPSAAGPMVELRGVRKRLGGRLVLDGVDLTIHRGEVLVILGRSGIGKTVTLKHIIGLLDPDAGEIRLKGLPLARYRARGSFADLRRHIGYLFQSGGLLGSLNVGDNIALPLKEHTRLDAAGRAAKVREKLALANLPGAERRYPSQLSIGMRKRAGLARALVLDPELILYDEPTSGLDPVTTTRINLLIRDLQRKIGVTSIVVTHDIRSAYTVGDRIAMLHDGKIVQLGTPEEIRRTDNPLVRQFIDGRPTGPLDQGDQVQPHVRAGKELK